MFLQVQGGDVEVKAVDTDLSVLGVREARRGGREDTSADRLPFTFIWPPFPTPAPPPPFAPLRNEPVWRNPTLCKGRASFVVVVICLSRSCRLPPPPAFTRYFFDFLRGFFCEGHLSEWDNAA